MRRKGEGSESREISEAEEGKAEHAFSLFLIIKNEETSVFIFTQGYRGYTKP